MAWGVGAVYTDHTVCVDAFPGRLGCLCYDPPDPSCMAERGFFSVLLHFMPQALSTWFAASSFRVQSCNQMHDSCMISSSASP